MDEGWSERRDLLRWGDEGVVVPLDVAGEGVVDVDGGVGEAVGEFLAAKLSIEHVFVDIENPV